MSNKLNYNGVADLRANYPDFFWKKVRPYIGDALRYLRITQEGQQWIANLYAHVFSMEHRGQPSHAFIVEYAALSQSVIQLTKIADGMTHVNKAPNAASVSE
jgi:hypothetical protein